MSELYDHNISVIETCLAQAGPRKAVAHTVGISDSQLSKMLNGSLRSFCLILEVLDLEVVPRDYFKAIKTVAKDGIRP